MGICDNSLQLAEETGNRSHKQDLSEDVTRNGSLDCGDREMVEIDAHKTEKGK